MTGHRVSQCFLPPIFPFPPIGQLQ
jgi:hypothetical protein